MRCVGVSPYMSCNWYCTDLLLSLYKCYDRLGCLEPALAQSYDRRVLTHASHYSWSCKIERTAKIQ